MKRQLLDKLLAWKAKPTRKPLLIDGARQTGKTYLLTSLFGQHFNKVVHVDFLESPQLADAFVESLNPIDVLSNIELLTGEVFTPATDLLVLDEIGECPKAITALKYFAEKAPYMYITASGSNIGLLGSFPVGKVTALHLYPLSFREFLWASGEQALINVYDNKIQSATAHRLLFDKLTDYYFTGGLPEAVHKWFDMANQSIIHRTEAVEGIHADLLAGYLRDFGKYANQGTEKVNAQVIESVFTSIPHQLASVVDESVKRFKFKGVHQRKSRYADFDSAISWLHRCRLLLKNYPIDGMPRTPFSAYRKDNMVKLFLFDVGLLNHMLSTSYKTIKQQGYEYKGYVAENFVQQELAVHASGSDTNQSFSWQDARAEIEFILSNEHDDIIPVEVKSGKRTRAKSLVSYIQKYNPDMTIKLVGSQGASLAQSLDQTPKHLVLPLYFAEFIYDVVDL